MHVDLDAFARFGAEDDVLENREVVGQHEVLEHHADARSDCVFRRLEVLLDTVDLDATFVGALGAIENLHHGGLARPVLANERVNGSWANRHVDAIVGHYSGKSFHDVAKFDGIRGGLRHICSGDNERGAGIAGGPSVGVFSHAINLAGCSGD